MKKGFDIVTLCCISSGFLVGSSGGLPIIKVPAGIKTNFIPLELEKTSPGEGGFFAGLQPEIRIASDKLRRKMHSNFFFIPPPPYSV
jgi:hypothetical protein